MEHTNENAFLLNTTLKNDSIYVTDYTLCEVRLINNKDFIWFILIPKVSNVISIDNLNAYDQSQLIYEISHTVTKLKKLYSYDRVNVASLGNIVEQMHWHIILRHTTDLYWPNPVWGNPITPRNDQENTYIINNFLDT